MFWTGEGSKVTMHNCTWSSVGRIRVQSRETRGSGDVELKYDVEIELLQEMRLFNEARLRWGGTGAGAGRRHVDTMNGSRTVFRPEQLMEPATSPMYVVMGIFGRP